MTFGTDLAQRSHPRAGVLARARTHRVGRLSVSAATFGSHLGLSQLSRWDLTRSSAASDAAAPVRPPIDYWPDDTPAEQRAHSPRVEALEPSGDRRRDALRRMMAGPKVAAAPAATRARPIRRGLPRAVGRRRPTEPGAIAPTPGGLAVHLRPTEIDPAAIPAATPPTGRATPTADDTPVRRSPSQGDPALRLRSSLTRTGKVPPASGDAPPRRTPTTTETRIPRPGHEHPPQGPAEGSARAGLTDGGAPAAPLPLASVIRRSPDTRPGSTGPDPIRTSAAPTGTLLRLPLARGIHWIREDRGPATDGTAALALAPAPAPAMYAADAVTDAGSDVRRTSDRASEHPASRRSSSSPATSSPATSNPATSNPATRESSTTAPASPSVERPDPTTASPAPTTNAPALTPVADGPPPASTAAASPDDPARSMSPGRPSASAQPARPTDPAVSADVLRRLIDAPGSVAPSVEAAASVGSPATATPEVPSARTEVPPRARPDAPSAAAPPAPGGQALARRDAAIDRGTTAPIERGTATSIADPAGSRAPARTTSDDRLDTTVQRLLERPLLTASPPRQPASARPGGLFPVEPLVASRSLLTSPVLHGLARADQAHAAGPTPLPDTTIGPPDAVPPAALRPTSTNAADGELAAAPSVGSAPAPLIRRATAPGASPTTTGSLPRASSPEMGRAAEPDDRAESRAPAREAGPAPRPQVGASPAVGDTRPVPDRRPDLSQPVTGSAHVVERATAAPLQRVPRPPVTSPPTSDPSDPSDPSTTDTPRAPLPPDDPAERFVQVLRRSPRPRHRPLPRRFAPLAAAIVGDRPVQISTDDASRAALDSVGKVAATTGDVIHLARAPQTRADEAIVAHELTHVAHPSPAPRFFDDDRHSPEERRAEQIADVIRRSPVLPRSAAAAELGRRGGTSPAPAGVAPAGAASVPDIIRRSMTSRPAGSVDAGTVSARDLAERLGAGGSASPAPPHSGPDSVIVRRSPTGFSATARPASQGVPVSTDPIRRTIDETSTSTSSTASGYAFPFDLGSPEGERDFVQWLVERLGDRMVRDLERRGGQFRRDF